MKVVAAAPLSQGRYYVLDGGFSTQLSRYVAGVDQDPLWTARSLVENKEAVLKVHRDFLSAGADIILTSSYQASKGRVHLYIFSGKVGIIPLNYYAPKRLLFLE